MRSEIPLRLIRSSQFQYACFPRGGSRERPEQRGTACTQYYTLHVTLRRSSVTSCAADQHRAFESDI